MALTVTPQILGQQADSRYSYCYLWEPLRVVIEETDLAANKVYIELTTYKTEDLTILNEAVPKYAEFDINPGQPLTVDLMKIAQQYHDANVYKYSNLNEMTSASGGWKSVVSELRYKFRISSDIVSVPTALPGTVTVAAASTTVAGSGTSFTTDAYDGMEIEIDGERFAVEIVTNDTELEINHPHTLGATAVVPYTNLTPVEIRKIPIIGGRIFKDFTPGVLSTIQTNEAEVHGVDFALGRYAGMPYLTTTLANPVLQDARPTIIAESVAGGEGGFDCGVALIWKSRRGGWMAWGFKQLNENYSGQRYSGMIEVGMFESTDVKNGNPFVPVNYTGVTSDYSITAKELSLTSEELQAVASISSSPVVYRVLGSDGSLELMRVSSATHPLINSANGGDFSVTLKSISQTSQNTR